MIKKFAFIALNIGFIIFTNFDMSVAAFNEQIATDAKAMSLGNAVTADPPGIMSIHYNPAGLSLIEHDITYSAGISVTSVSFKGDYTADPNFDGFFGSYFTLEAVEGEGDTRGISHIPFTNSYLSAMLTPQYGISYRKKESKWTFALGGYEPFSLGWEQTGSNNPSEFDGATVIHQHFIYAAPSVSYKATPKLSFGFSLGLGTSFHKNQFMMRIPSETFAQTMFGGDATEHLDIPFQQQMTLPMPLYGGGIAPYDEMAVLDIEMEDIFSPSLNTGILWSPLKWLSLGLTYQSEIKIKMEGTYNIKHSNDTARMMDWFGYGTVLPTAAALMGLPTDGSDQSGKCRFETILPQHVQLGVKLMPVKPLKLLIDVHWADWSSTGDTNYVFDQDLSILKLARLSGYSSGTNRFIIERKFKDTVHWSLGIEYNVLEWLDLRCGYEKRPTSVKDEYFDLMYPVTDFNVYGAGFGLILKNGILIDFGLSYMDGGTYTVKNEQSSNMNSSDWTKPIYNPHLGLDYKQKSEIISYSLKVSVPISI